MSSNLASVTSAVRSPELATASTKNPNTTESPTTTEPLMYRPEPIRVGEPATVVIQPVGGVALNNSTVTLTVVEFPDGRFLQADLENAAVPARAAYWTTEVNGRLRVKTTARQGSTLGTRVDRDVYCGSFNFRFSATTTEGDVLATTGNVQIVE